MLTGQILKILKEDGLEFTQKLKILSLRMVKCTTQDQKGASYIGWRMAFLVRGG